MPRPSVGSAIANRLATYWVIETLASYEFLNFSVLQALLRTLSEPLNDAPVATRERLALRCLQELMSSVVAPGEDATATAGVLVRVDAARSCEDLVDRIHMEVESSGKLDKDLLLPFVPEIQETIRTKKITLPEPSLQLQLIIGMMEDLEIKEDVLGAAEAERRPHKMLKRF